MHGPIPELPNGEKSLSDAYDLAAQHVRALDQDRYLATLFAPRDSQPHLFALYAFNAEITRVRTLVSDPLPGEMRYQWWRDLLLGKCHGEARLNPLALAFLATIEKFKLPIQPLVDLIEARTFDLYDDPMPTWLDCEGYCGETSSVLMRLATFILTGGIDEGGAEAAGHAGVAYALTGLLRAFPWTSRRGQIVLPKEVFEAHGVSEADLRAGKDSPGLRAALADVRIRARGHLEDTRKSVARVSSKVAPAFFPACFVDPYLKAMEARDYDPFSSRVDVSPLKKLFTLWFQSRRACR